MFLNAYKENHTLWEEWPEGVATLENVILSRVMGMRKVVRGVGKAGVELVKVLGKVEGVSNASKTLVTSA